MTIKMTTTRKNNRNMTVKNTALLATCALGISGLLAGCGQGAEPDQALAVETEQTEAALASARGIRFGVAPQWYQSYAPPGSGPANVDAVAVGDWLVESGFTDAHQKKIDAIVANKKTPYFFGYIATALTKKGLGQSNDCDGNASAKLCQEGADYIRSHMSSEIVPAYKAAALRIGGAVGSAEALIHVEPDWYQFSENAQRNAFSRTESNGFMNQILGAVSAGCPSCKVVIDFSPWFSPSKTRWATSAADFYAGWDRKVVKYVGLTGKPFPFTENKIDNYTYREISTQLALPLIVIDAYTFGGGPIDVDKSWMSVDNLAKAADMGIAMIFMSQQGDVAGYDRFIKDFRGSAAPPPPSTDPTPTPTPTPPAPTPVGSVSVAVSLSSSWASGYCNRVVVTNRGTASATWTARVPRKGTIYNSWSSVLKIESSDWVFTGLDYNRTLSPSQSIEFGYCANN